MQKRSSHAIEPQNEDIALLAHYFYVTEGRRDGHDIEHWLRAKDQLSNGRPSDNTAQEPANSKKNLTEKKSRARRTPTGRAGARK